MRAGGSGDERPKRTRVDPAGPRRTGAAGKSLVRSVSCVASPASRRGRLSTNAAWSWVAPQAVMR